MLFLKVHLDVHQLTPRCIHAWKSCKDIQYSLPKAAVSPIWHCAIFNLSNSGCQVSWNYYIDDEMLSDINGLDIWKYIFTVSALYCIHIPMLWKLYICFVVCCCIIIMLALHTWQHTWLLQYTVMYCISWCLCSQVMVIIALATLVGTVFFQLDDDFAGYQNRYVTFCYL